MTDKEIFSAMLDRSGVKWTTDSDPSGNDIVRIETGAHSEKGPNRGYTGFYTDVLFDRRTGALVAIGAWE